MKKYKKPKKGAWFYPARGSYFPCSWQAWLMYLVAFSYLSFAAIYVYNQEPSVGWFIFILLKDFILTGIVLTWIAVKKS